jgi:hypothetical protein
MELSLIMGTVNTLISFYAVYAIHIAFKVSSNGAKLIFWRAKKRESFPEIALKVKERFKKSRLWSFP